MGDASINTKLLAGRLRQWGDRLVAGKKLPSMATQVWHRGRKINTTFSGFSDVDAAAALTGNELYVMASCTKIVTSVAALQLYEQGERSALILYRPTHM